jgi:hypothetical protein
VIVFAAPGQDFLYFVFARVRGGRELGPVQGLGLGRHRALLDAHEFELDSVQISTAVDPDEIGLPPATAAAIVATHVRSWPTSAIVAHFKPAPEPEPDEPEPELSASAQHMAALSAVPMAEWSEEQVLAWAELVELEPETRAALRTAFDDEDTECEELVVLTAKPLQKMLKRAGLPGDLPAAAEAVLALRDAMLVPAPAAAPSLPPYVSTGQKEQRANGCRWNAVSAMPAAEAGLAAAATAATTATAAEAPRTLAVADAAAKAEEAVAKAEEVAKPAPSCHICFEPYGGAVVARILVACGHTFCEGCLSTMLHCAARTRMHTCTIARRSARVTARPGSRAGRCRPRAGASG